MKNTFSKKLFFPMMILILIGVFSRLMPHPPNLTAIGAVALFLGAYSKKRNLFFLIPIIAMFVSDLFLFYIQGKIFPGLVVYLSLLAYVPIGFLLIKKIKIKNVLVGCLSGSTFFFIVTNFFVWLNPTYINVTKTSSSLFACYFDGLPFYGYSICGDIMWSAIIFGAYELSNYSIKKLSLLPTKD